MYLAVSHPRQPVLLSLFELSDLVVQLSGCLGEALVDIDDVVLGSLRD